MENVLENKFIEKKYIENLNLSYTHTSARSLVSLHRLEKLKVLYLDYCPSLSSKGQKNVFSLLIKRDPIPNLEVVSIVGTSSTLSHKWFSHIEVSCPKLKAVFFTRKKGIKVGGLKDIVSGRTMVEPIVLPCGHISDLKVIDKERKCSIDDIEVDPLECIAINPSICHLYFEHNEWHVEVVDVLRKHLSKRAIYHFSCGTFF